MNQKTFPPASPWIRTWHCLLIVAMLLGIFPAQPVNATATWVNVASMSSHHHQQHAAVLLPNGKVLIIGGTGADGVTELYDPNTNSWTTMASINKDLNFPKAVLLPTGKVLVIERDTNSVEIFDPAMNVWTTAAPMSISRIKPTMTLLPNGKVLVTGGFISIDMKSLFVGGTPVTIILLPMPKSMIPIQIAGKQSPT